MISLTPVPEKGQLRINLTGFLLPDEGATFALQYQHFLSAPGMLDEFSILIDASEATVQHREIAEMFEQLVRASPRKARKIAIVVASRLLNLQVRRVFEARSNSAVFDNLPDAELWLAGRTG